ncbi:MATE family efflux transporter [Brachyspira catarrhinii]|uniref:Multidrug export protein MepA n=1 Tax=Brachyspira catarrhinii TaxID=2528966 RepID=A0ABY2TRL7_9SPIR|nr:MATE family efflux transporter [Brachyspira catarrhinii]TKZ35538.1 MATE family efflux transporter [Brachyspira catarrhinii]
MTQIKQTRTVEEMNKSFFKYVIPAVIGTLLGGLYTIVDGYFVGNTLGDTGLAAINIVYPVGSILFAIGSMIGMGGSVIMSIHIGAGEIEKSEEAKITTLFNLIIASILVTIILFTLKNPIIHLLGARGEVFREANAYATIVILGGSFQIMSMGCMPIVRNQGKMLHATAFVSSGLITNIILDYLFMMVFHWGMAGAALATIIAEGIVGICGIYYLFIRKKSRTRVSLKKFNPKMSAKALFIGLSPFGMIMSPSLIVILNNLQCLKYGGEIAVSAYSVANYIYSSTLLFFEGVAEGCQPMISFFKGAREYKLMKRVFKKGIISALILSALFITAVFIFKNKLGLIFGASTEANNIITFALPIIAVAFLMQSIVRLGTSYLYSSGNGFYSTLMTYIDPLFISPLCILILPIFFKLNGVWFAIPTAQGILLILFLSIFFKTNNENILNKTED